MRIQKRRGRVLRLIALLSGLAISGCSPGIQCPTCDAELYNKKNAVIHSRKHREAKKPEVIWCSIRQKVSPDVYVLRQIPDGGNSIKSERSFVISRSEDGALIYVSQLLDIVVDEDVKHEGLTAMYFGEDGDSAFDEKAYFGKVLPR